MKTSNNLIFKTVFILLALALVTSSCKKDDKTAPEIPPQSSFVMDFSDFSNPGDTLGSREISTYHNWGYSYNVVLNWQTILTVELAIPAAAFSESFNHEAVYHPDEENWTWSYNVIVNDIVYEAELTGYLVADSVAWEMRVTAGSLFSDFLWYYGRSALDQSGGWWILQENPLNPNALLQIDWHKNSDGTADIGYMNIRPGDNDNGAYIFYGTTLNSFDRFYHLYNINADNLTEIEWSSVNKDGHVKDPAYFGHSNWNCWDASLMDVACP